MPEEMIELSGHLIDSFILPKVLDTILRHDACYEIKEITVGINAKDSSFARILVAHRDPKQLLLILREISRYGAEPINHREVQLIAARLNGVFPDNFYATTNLDTYIYLNKSWLPVKNPEMDSGIKVVKSRLSAGTVKMADVKKGDLIVVGHEGVRITPIEALKRSSDFSFMTSAVSTEKPKGLLITDAARLLKAERNAGRPIFFVCGPAIVHTGAGPLLVKLIEAGYVQVLFAGNALAAHDIECALYGTSLGVSINGKAVTIGGHENHLRAINAIRKCGGIRRAVHNKLLQSGIMYACVQNNVDFVLAGSIRDDGPLPEVITDSLQAQAAMRKRCRSVKLVIMVATLLHSVAIGNILPASARVICADIDPGVVTKLHDRGSLQTIGIVTDAQPFLQELLLDLRIK